METNVIQDTQDSDSDIPCASQLERCILAEIRDKYGKLDKQLFKRELSNNLDITSLRHIRSSLHDIGRLSHTGYPSGRLVERTSRSDSAPVKEKIADDIYTIFHFLEGDGNTSEVKACMSRYGKRRPSRIDSVSCLKNLQETSQAIDQSNDIDQSRGNTSIEDYGNNSQPERVESSIPILQYETFIDLKQFVKDELNAISANITEELKRMRKDNVRLGEIIQSKDDTIKRLESCIDKSRESELRLESDLHVMADVIKNQAMTIEKLQAVNDRQIETVSAQMRGIQLQLTNFLQLSCSYANITRSLCPTASASGTPNTVLNTCVFDSQHIESKKRILSDQQEYRRNTNVEVSKVPIYKNRTHDLVQSQVAQSQNTSSSAAICEAGTGRTKETNTEEKENKTNQHQVLDAKLSSLRKNDMNDTNNNNMKPIQVRIGTMTFSGTKRGSKTKSLLLSRIKADYGPEELNHVIRRHAYNRGVQVTNIKILKKWFNMKGDTYTVRVTVPEKLFTKTLQQGFWPEFVLAREWYER
ncbi:hypothetical protein ACJMK2_038956 [Sinanodonta woodiana]|uniref:Uncharacterized protein n=1 Tax=Sinanodonta woodiana TaxID=1069815 RepID=A0ABD3WDW0_SINWO